MGQAREVMDRFTETALVNRDLKAAEECFADAVLVDTPDRGRLTGRDAVMDYARQFFDAFPDVRITEHRKYEDGNTAIDESIYVGTHQGPLIGADGTTVPATGRQLRLRSCEVAVVTDGVITEYRFYYDQVEFLTQLGLMEAPTG